MPRIAQFRGDTTSHLIPLSYKGAAFSPGSAWSLIFTAKRHSEDADADAVIQKVTGAGIAVAGSNATLTIVGLDTESVEDRDLVWDIRATSIATGERRTVSNGALAIIGNVGRESQTSIPVFTADPPFPAVIPVILRSVADGRPILGSAQIETLTVVAPSGITANGIVPLFVTMGGTIYPLSLNVTAAGFPTAASIAAGLAGRINANSAIAALYTATSNGADVVMTRKTPAANDGTLNMQLTGGNGVSAVTTSTNTQAGVAPGTPPLASAIGQMLRYGDSSPFEWYRWDGEIWENTTQS